MERRAHDVQLERRARFNVQLDGDIARLIFGHLKPLRRAAARLVCRDWRDLIKGPVQWKPVDIAYGLCGEYPLFELFTSHWTHIPRFTSPNLNSVISRIFKDDHVDALNWLAKRPMNGLKVWLTVERLAPDIIARAAEKPRIYHWLLVRSRYETKDRICVFWNALYLMQPNDFVSFLDSASIIDTKHADPFTQPTIPSLSCLSVTSDDQSYAKRLANLTQLAAPRWGICRHFWYHLCLGIFNNFQNNADACRRALCMVCEAYGEVPLEFCEFLKSKNKNKYHRSLHKWCKCPNKKTKR